MKWQEVRNIYPNQFVKFEIMESELQEDQEIVEEVAVIGPIRDEEATNELLKSKNNTIIYHTSKAQVIIKIRNRNGLRRTH
ncbi:hypothetical protein [Paenibacillus sp. RC67]|uniref:hypothetical protein n=1 Tax=Paenibacillus sp. RC67 TaxID=3039392 RepID=UPI0024AE8213|nr:hypothetical protein [Paenibacillus sp. RC67]